MNILELTWLEENNLIFEMMMDENIYLGKWKVLL